MYKAKNPQTKALQAVLALGGVLSFCSTAGTIVPLPNGPRGVRVGWFLLFCESTSCEYFDLMSQVSLRVITKINLDTCETDG